MENYVGRVWVLLAILAVVVVIWWQGDALGPIEPKPGDAPFLVALTQLGILYIVALFVERSLEVLIKAWRQAGRTGLEQEKDSETDDGKRKEIAKNLEEYRAGTQRRALLLGLTLGILVSLSGVRLLGPIFQFDTGDGWSFQEGVFQFTDIIVTAGLIAGGSSTIHELMALVDDFLKASRKSASQDKEK